MTTFPVNPPNPYTHGSHAERPTPVVTPTASPQITAGLSLESGRPPHIPTFREINRKRTRTVTGSMMAGYTHGPRWAHIVVDRDHSFLPEKRWPDGSTRTMLSALASDMSLLFVWSHTRRSCFVSSFDSDYVTLHTPIKCADAIVAVLVLAELGDVSLAHWFAPEVHAAAERLRAIPTRRERLSLAGPITDEMARTIARMWRPTRTTERSASA